MKEEHMVILQADLETVRNCSLSTAKIANINALL